MESEIRLIDKPKVFWSMDAEGWIIVEVEE